MKYVVTILSVFLLWVVDCISVFKNSNIAWLKDKNWPETHVTEQLDTENRLKDYMSAGDEGFHLVTYLPRSQEKGFCKGIVKAINMNAQHENIEMIHLFRHPESCIRSTYIPRSNKIVMNELKKGDRLTFADVMNFLARHCANKNVILARANMYLPLGINIFKHIGIRPKEVHILNSVHPFKSQQRDTYYGTHFAFIFKGQWDTSKDYHQEINLNFDIDSPNLDNENVLKKVFETNLKMTLISSGIKATCYHED